MLLGFSFENFASFYHETIFSMLASKKDEFLDLNTINTSHGRLLKSALIFGPNGSGKTNWVKALNFMQDMVFTSVIDKNILKRNENFKFFDSSYSQPTSFEISFIQNGIAYEYGFKILKDEIIEEWLNKKAKRTVPIFYRNNSDWNSIELRGSMKKAEKIKKFTRKDSLFLTTAAMFNIDVAEEILNWFSNLYILVDDFGSPKLTVDYIQEDIDNKAKVLNQLKIADIGIEDFDIQIRELDVDNDLKEKLIQSAQKNLSLNSMDKFKVKRKAIDSKTKHHVYDEDKKIAYDIELSFLKYQSKGTIKFFELLGPILDVLENGKVLVVDEIDSRLHCGIVEYILEMFNSIDKNSKNGQLICNTHNVLLLDEDIRRDQIWFIQKDNYGESELYSLDDFKDVRKDDPKLKKYLLGVYGAIPNMNRDDIYG